jgi:uncharacterized protein (TIGR02271 family)
MANYEERGDRFTAVEDEYSGYTVRDLNGEKIGKVDDLFLDENDHPEYFGVKTGFLGTRSTLIPVDVTTIDNERGFIEVSQPKQEVKDGPSFDDDREITPEYENEVRSYYGLSAKDGNEQSGRYGKYYGDEPGHVGPGIREGDTETGEFRGHSKDNEGVNQSGTDDLEDEDELRVQRTEEELRAGTREREAGALNVRKRVRTDREQISVPTRHEEVSVERVPVEGGREASEAEIGEDEVYMPVTEEEVVTEKRPVVKEELRIRKDVVEDAQVVEEDVRREEVDVEDQTERGRGRLGRDTDLLDDEDTRRRGR